MESLIRGCVGKRSRGKVEGGELLSKTGIFTNGQNEKSKNVRGNLKNSTFVGGRKKKRRGGGEKWGNGCAGDKNAF